MLKALNLWRTKIEKYFFFPGQSLILAAGIIYLIGRYPYLCAVVISASLLFCLLWLAIEKLMSACQIKQKIGSSPIIIGIATVVFSLSFEQRASAYIIYERLENFLRELINQTHTATNTSTVDSLKSLGLIFNAARVITLLMIVGSIVQAKRLSDDNQSNRVMLDILTGTFAFVFVVEIISFVVVGGT